MAEMCRRSSITLVAKEKERWKKEKRKECQRKPRGRSKQSDSQPPTPRQRHARPHAPPRPSSLVVGVGGHNDEAVPAPDLLQDAHKHLPVRKPGCRMVLEAHPRG
jgi:hypothetical protein